jgi:hypothetical protein
LIKDRKYVIKRRGFENQYNLYGKLKREDIQDLNYETADMEEIEKTCDT